MHNGDTANNKQNVLIVDDEDLLRIIFRAALEKDGYSVSEASSGNEAWSKLALRDFDVVISDVRMPDGDGLMLLERLRERDARRPFLIFVTGFCDISEADAVARGASAMFAKPSDLNGIRKKVKELLAPDGGPALHG